MKNTGNVTLTNVTLSDPDATVLGGPIASLAVGASDSTTFTGSYTVTQVDIDAGSFTNTATVTGKSPAGANVTAMDDDTQTFTLSPSLTITKVVDKLTYAAANTLLNYTVTVMNTGNVTLENAVFTDFVNLTIPDTMVKAGDTDLDGHIDVGETWTYTGTYTTTQEDLYADRTIVNTASITTNRTAEQIASVYC